MLPFTPTLGIKDSSINIRKFIKDNSSLLWDIVKPLLPWIIGLHILDMAINVIYFPDSKNEFTIGSLVSSYFYTCLVITWHRVVIHGPDNFISMNPYKPKKHELVFIGMGILLGVAGIVVGVLAGAMVAIIPIIGIPILIITIVLLVLLSFRLSFYFPAKAVNSSISLKESYYLSKGYFWLLTGTIIRAPIWVLLKLIGYSLAAFIILMLTIMTTSMVTGHEPNQSGVALNVIAGLFMIPVIAYFYPLLYAYGVTVLSNYYQYAIQHKGFSSSDQS